MKHGKRLIQHILIMLSISIQCSCSLFVTVDGYNCRKLLGSIPLSDGGLEVSKFNALDEEKKYAFFMCENVYYEPPLDRITYYYAQDGEKIVPLLKDRLSKTNDDFIIFRILDVFEQMQRQKIYDVSKQHDLLSFLDAKVDSMQDSTAEYGSYKDLAKSTMKTIKYQLPFTDTGK